MTPLVSIVTGTYNRLPYLQQMVDSARRSIPTTLSHEFVICDGGSTDGTLEWLREQRDVVLLEHGELRGALKAFGDAARAATGEYVILANDDIVFHPGAILAALSRLDSDATCGAVAFKDNRPAPGYNGKDYKVQVINAFDPRLNEAVSVPYPQVGMIRRWLGEAAGWWGDQSAMKDGHTYGGDSWLGARIWELGYTVGVVDAARIDDLIPNDSLRETNYRAEQANPGVFYKAYPNPPTIAYEPQLDNPQSEHLRVLYLPIYEPGYGRYKSGLRDALAKVGWVVEWDYLNEPGQLADYVEAWQPHVLLMQLHGTDRITQADLAAAREKCPSMIVANWNGDVYPEHLISRDMLSLLRHVDLQLVVNDDVLATYRASGIHAAYWQVAFEPVDADRLPRVAGHDVVFLGNVAKDNKGRQAIGHTLRSMQGVDVGLYGFGWPFANGNTTYNFAAGAALYQSAKIAVGDNQFPNERGFVSNRIFEALAAGAFLLHQRVEGLEELTGLQDGVHYVEWTDTADLQAKIKYYINPKHAAKRRAIAEAGRAFVRERHSFDNRVKELFEVLLPMIESERELM